MIVVSQKTVGRSTPEINYSGVARVSRKLNFYQVCSGCYDLAGFRQVLLRESTRAQDAAGSQLLLLVFSATTRATTPRGVRDVPRPAGCRFHSRLPSAGTPPQPRQTQSTICPKVPQPRLSDSPGHIFLFARSH